MLYLQKKTFHDKKEEDDKTKRKKGTRKLEKELEKSGRQEEKYRIPKFI